MQLAVERQRVIDALDKLISARKEAVELILKRFAAKYADDFDAVGDAALEVAMREVKKAGRKLPPWHPDSEEWTDFEELRIVAAAAREKTHDMTEEARWAWVSNTTAKVREHAAQMDRALQRFRQEMLEGARIEEPRLTVNVDQRTATLDGQTYDVKSQQALRWLKVLADRPGDWISSTHLHLIDPELDGVRTHRLRKYLPEPIADLIESDTGKGSRLTMA
jgi:hypothetical protein